MALIDISRRRSSFVHLTLAGAVCAALAAAWPASASELAISRLLSGEEREGQAVSLGALQPDGPVKFSIAGGLSHQFKSDIDDGGEFGITRFGAGVSAQVTLSEDMEMLLAFRYDLADYNFSGTTMLAPGGVMEPWEDIHTISFAAVFTLNLDEQWSIYGGPVAQMARESGANAGDSWVGGGVFGARYAVSPELVLGLGLGIVSQIEDDVRVFPSILIHWKLMDNLWLSTRAMAESTGDTGTELVYYWSDTFETAIGAAYRFRRFRLDDGGGAAPDGVGQHTHMPVWIRAGWRATPNLTVNAQAGLALAGELRLESSSGSRIGKEDYDPAAVFGVNVLFRF